jgi:site-specific recombinase XerD
MADATGNTRDRAIILTMWSTGLRVSTLTALNLSDIQRDLLEGQDNLLVPVYPGMKEWVPDACKGEIPYFSFTSKEATTAIKVYLKERTEQFGSISGVVPLFHSDWHLWAKEERSGMRLGRRGVGLIVKRAARLAGLSEWESVTSHCLRKAFESVLRSQTLSGGRLDKGTQEFLFGHILPGSQDVYFDRSKPEFLREEYSGLDFGKTATVPKVRDKLIPFGELESHFEVGWVFIASVPGGKAIVRRGN